MDKLRALKFFCRVAETKSFAAAAYELDVVPSVLSKQIAALETDLHFKLFNRTTRRVSLTEPGTRYYDHCKRLLIDLDEAELLERGGIAKAAGKIVVGMHPAINRVLMARIDEFLTTYPDIVVETTITSTPATMLDDKLDLLVTLADLPDSSFGVRTIGTTRHVLAASPGYLKKHGVPRTPDDLRKHVFIVSGRPDGPSYARWTMKRGSEVQTIYVPVRMISRQGRSHLRSLPFRRRDQPAGRSPHSPSNQTRRTRTGASGLVLEHAANSGRGSRQQEGAGKGEGSCRISSLDHQGSR